MFMDSIDGTRAEGIVRDWMRSSRSAPRFFTDWLEREKTRYLYSVIDDPAKWEEVLTETLDYLIECKPNVQNYWTTRQEHIDAMLSEEAWVSQGQRRPGYHGGRSRRRRPCGPGTAGSRHVGPDLNRVHGPVVSAYRTASVPVRQCGSLRRGTQPRPALLSG